MSGNCDSQGRGHPCLAQKSNHIPNRDVPLIGACARMPMPGSGSPGEWNPTINCHDPGNEISLLGVRQVRRSLRSLTWFPGISPRHCHSAVYVVSYGIRSFRKRVTLLRPESGGDGPQWRLDYSYCDLYSQFTGVRNN